MKQQLDGFRQALVDLDGRLLAVDARFAKRLALFGSELAFGRDVTDAGLASLQARNSSDRSVLSLPPSAAYLSLNGMALYDFEMQPYAFSTKKLAADINERSADPSVSCLILHINTPGGHVTGTEEAAEAVYRARQRKPVIGIVDALCASAGYWIGSQCTKLIGVPSADVGSIGVFRTHYDVSAAYAAMGVKPTFIYAGEYKTEGNCFEPLSDSGRAFYQSEVDDTYRQFISAVARGRNKSESAVRANFGGGRCFDARRALSVGMIDQIATPSQAFSIAASSSRTRSVASHHKPPALSDNQQLAAAARARLAILSA